MSAHETVAVGPGVELCDGRYRLERTIGIGGMASVWLGRDQRLDRPVAVKVLSDTLASDPAYVQRFRREAQTAARLSHPNLVKVFDYESEARPVLIMEYVEGGTLDETANRPETAVEVEALAAQLLGVLEHIHAAGIVHRDVKPENVLIDTDGRALLTDFGIAQHQDATRITQTGQVIGTIAYMAPEVLEGERATPQADLYSCGKVLRDHLDADSAPGLVQLVERLTEHDPERRPASAKHALAYLGGSVPTALTAADRPAVTTQTRPARPAPDTQQMPARTPPPAARPPQSPAAPRPEPRLPSEPSAPPREYSIRAGHVLAALALLAAVIAVIAIATGGDDGSGEPRRGAPAADAEQPAAEPEPAAEQPAPEAETATTGLVPAPKPNADPAKGAALEDQAFDLLATNPEAAIAAYEKAFREIPEELRTPEAFAEYNDYAFALYSYADALIQVGRADEAIPVLEARLQFDNQIETVQAKLDEAEAAAAE